MFPEPLACCVCGGDHHAMQCVRARRFIVECQNARISPPPELPPEPDQPSQLAIDATRVLRLLLDELVVEDAAASTGPWCDGNRAWHIRQGHKVRH